MSTSTIIRACLEDIIGIAFICGFLVAMKPHHLQLIPNKENLSSVLSTYTSEVLLVLYGLSGLSIFFLVRCWTARLQIVQARSLQRSFQQDKSQEESDTSDVKDQDQNSDEIEDENNSQLNNGDTAEEIWKSPFHNLFHIDTTTAVKHFNDKPLADDCFDNKSDAGEQPFNLSKYAVISPPTSSVSNISSDPTAQGKPRKAKPVRRLDQKKRKKARERAASTTNISE